MSEIDSIPECFRFRFSLEEHVAPIIWLAWSPDGNSLASCSADFSVMVWDMNVGKMRGKLNGHHDAVVALAWSPDGNIIASGSYDQKIILWDQKTLTKTGEIYLEFGSLNDLAWSPDGRYIAAGFDDGSLGIFDASTYQTLRIVDASDKSLYSIYWAPDSSYLVSAAFNSEFVVWETANWDRQKVLDNAPAGIYDISISPDGKILAAGGEANGITFFNTDSWSQAFSLEGHTDDVTCVRFSNDGRYVASKSFDDTVRLWDISQQKEIAKLYEPSQNYWLSGLAWHPEKLVLATLGNGDSIIRVWDIDPNLLKKQAPDRISGAGITRSRPAKVNVKRPPADLINACLENNCVVCVGAGLASEAGFPTWNDFVQKLLDWSLNHKFLKAEIADSLREALAIGNSAQVADIIVSEVNQTNEGQQQLNNYLVEVFTSSSEILPNTYTLLRNIPFFAALTTNFDNLLERTYNQNSISLTPLDTDQLMGRLQTGDFFVLKLYGTVEKPKTVMLSPAQYESHVAENIVFSQFMESLFVSKTLFFVGASLEGIEVYLKALKIGSGHRTRQHYAFVNVVGNAWRVKADILQRRYGIVVIPFTASLGFPEVKQFLTSLQNQIGRRRDKELDLSESAPAEAKAPILKSIELKNIGPFEELSLNLDPQWNIFLGDNGVGKSNILKALALAFIGEDGRPFADRLVKSGTSTATISLEFEGEENNIKYITTISQTESGALVKSVPAAPIRVKGHLALGFPALRTISWDRNADIALTGKERPLPEDLLPLIEGKPDPRLDGLRSWLISLDHVIGSPDSTPTLKKSYSNLRNRFFKVIEKLMPDLKVKYKGVDLGTKKVLVETDDGIVPIESVSQGTTSLLGWIGVFLQRYFDIYGHSTNTTDNYALVLIDEIDAHMHPRWQQMIVPTLRELFPKVQFILTTHSPLIVAGLPAEQVFRFARNNRREVVQLENSPDMTFGYADQILTSDLFGLDSGLDIDTQKKQKRYYELLATENRNNDQENEYVLLQQELLFRVPPPFASYKERRHEMIEQADLLQMIGRQLKELGGDEFGSVADVIFTRGRKLLSDMGGSKDDTD